MNRLVLLLLVALHHAKSDPLSPTSVRARKSAHEQHHRCGICVAKSLISATRPVSWAYLRTADPAAGAAVTPTAAASACDAFCEKAGPEHQSSYFTVEFTRGRIPVLCKCYATLRGATVTSVAKVQCGSGFVMAQCRMRIEAAADGSVRSGHQEEGSPNLHYLHQKNAKELIEAFEQERIGQRASLNVPF